MRRKILLAIALLFILAASAVVFFALKNSASTSAQPSETPADTIITPSPAPVFDKIEPGLATYCVDKAVWDTCPEQGSVHFLSYKTCDYYENAGREVEKTMEVYLPYGYSEEIKYNVLFLLHGSHGTESYWLSNSRWYTYPDWFPDEFVCISDMLDNMIFQGLCEPCIVVSPTFYLTPDELRYEDNADRDAYRFTRELRNDILPALTNTYSTYDFGDKKHFGFIGASYGSSLMYKSVLCANNDLFSWYGGVSGFYTSVAQINSCTRGSEIDLLYMSAGSDEYALEDTVAGYHSLQETNPDIKDIVFVEIENAGHTDRVWNNAVYNCLQLFFKEA